MNVTFAAHLLVVLFLSEFLITRVVAFFFSSLVSSPTAKTDLPATVKLKNEALDFGGHDRKPHIIVILADDMGWNDVSFHGSDQIPTPNIDALAYNGIILNNHYVSALCTPSRAALMTGKYPIHLGMQHSVIFPAEPRGLPLGEKLLPQYLKELGYKTHAVGKWHLGFFQKEYTPTYRGFDSHFGYWNGLQDYYTHITQELDPEFSSFRGFDMRRNLTVAWETMGKYSTDLFTKEAIQLINKHDANQPMFLYLAHLAPHKGNQNQLLRAPDEEIAKFSYILDPERRIQAAVVSKLDQSVGKVMDALRSRGMLENSIVLFMSDNGAPTEGVLSNQGSNYPLRGIKDSPWEGGVRGVAAIWSPLIKKSRRVSNQMMFVADWLPTLLSAAGVDSRYLGHIDGFNLWPALVSNKISSRSEILINIDDLSNYAAIRRGDFKYVIGETDTGSAWLGASGDPSEGVSPEYDPYKVLHSKAGVAIAGVITTSQAMELNEKKKRVMRNANDIGLKTNFRDGILTAEEITKLRRSAQIKCNVHQKDEVACNPMRAPCLFNINKDPCEMVNLAEKRPVILAILERILLKYRVTTIPPSNLDGDPRANPALWNNTWTSWDEPNPLALSYVSTDEFQSYSRPAVAVVSIIVGLFIVGVMTLLTLKCGKAVSSNIDNSEYHDSHESIVYASTNNKDSFPMSKIPGSMKENSMLKQKERN
ncbi:arylsulfatase B-like [Hylaeus volcanicus]|uniref:arylsulfatase B-like n=1 Tax=Hylaeus volcanicus TaxID=313075 RepID=UPI0023B80181|nr:arylsulfatase B-like [Hylaeus volcanicus]XP_053973150.1 arylsulfatase B-like [Hylaeus volcanicus]